MARIGVFGGSFNPPHMGHMLAVREFQRKLGLDMVLLIPAAVPPHKSLSANSPDAQTRYEMTRLTAQTLSNAQALDIELMREGRSYTADTLDELHRRYPYDELFLLMGTDMLLSFEAWRQPERIAALATLAVAHRDADDPRRLASCAARLQKKLQARIEFVQNEFLPHSSTSVRALLAFGCAQAYLPEPVFSYIVSNGLYLTAQPLAKLPFASLRETSLCLHKSVRVAHVIGCSETAEALARHYGANEEDAKRAGILHDITKALNPQDQLHLCDSYGIILNHFQRKHPKLLHAVTGAAVARRIFGESDAVCEAIRWHTTGKAEMSTLEKIIYLADYTEPNRLFDGVDKLRRLTWTDLDAAMHLGLQMTVAQLTLRGSEIDPNSLAALRI